MTDAEITQREANLVLAGMANDAKELARQAPIKFLVDGQEHTPDMDRVLDLGQTLQGPQGIPGPEGPRGIPGPTGPVGPAGGSSGGNLLLGMWDRGFPTVSTVQAHEQMTGARYSIVSAFRGANGGDWLHDDLTVAAARAGYTVLVAWDMGSTAEFNFASWANGAHDAYLDQVISAAKSAPDVVIYVRPWAEMNVEFVPFQPGSTGPAAGTPTQFISAWKHVVDKIRNAGVTNIKFGFCPTTDTYAETIQDLSTIWPGVAWVDFLGLDGYNWGTAKGLNWTGFSDIYRAQYTKLTALDPNLPVWICEVGCKDPSVSEASDIPVDNSHSKAQWIIDMYGALASGFSRIKAVCWFAENKERSWNIDSSAAALQAWRSANRVSVSNGSSGGGGTSSGISVTVDSNNDLILSSSDPSALSLNSQGDIVIVQ